MNRFLVLVIHGSKLPWFWVVSGIVGFQMTWCLLVIDVICLCPRWFTEYQRENENKQVFENENKQISEFEGIGKMGMDELVFGLLRKENLKSF